MTALQVIWWLLVGVLLTVFVVLDGFDLGVGFWQLFTRNEREKQALVRSVGPLWDGNEVWLLTGAGALFAAFPPVYATVFSGLYLAMMLLLFALILRAVSLEFRNKLESAAWKGVWDKGFSVGSLLAALLLGIALGNILRGLPLDASGNYTGGFLDLLNGYALLVGALGVAMLLTHGALYIALRTEGDLHHRALGWARRSWVGTLGLALAAAVSTWIFEPQLLRNHHELWLLWCLPLLALLLLALIGWQVDRKRVGWAFATSSATLAAHLATAGASLFPNLVPALDPSGPSLTLANSSSSPTTLLSMLGLALLGMPLVIAYTLWTYRTFSGKISTSGPIPPGPSY